MTSLPELRYISGKGDTFPMLLHRGSTGPLHQTGVVMVHGLGETRIGLNGLFRELEQSLVQHGATVCRFDLVGHGEDRRLASLSQWNDQVATALQHIQSICSRTVLVTKGTGDLVLPSANVDYRIAIQPPSKETFEDGIEELESRVSNGYVSLTRHLSLSESENMLWWSLGMPIIFPAHLPWNLIRDIRGALEVRSAANLCITADWPEPDRLGVEPLTVAGDDVLLLAYKTREAVQQIIIRNLVNRYTGQTV